MYGAIIGDMVGSPYEFDQGRKVKDFGPLFINRSVFTDDSVMTIAVAEALMDAGPDASEKEIKPAVVKSMQKWGRKYPDAGYGGRFIGWLAKKDPKPYGSWGNGSAMRVSAVGWLYDSIERTREVARWTAEVTHNHPEGIKGAEATASAIFLAGNGSSKEEIKKYIIDEFGYDLSRTCDEIRPAYHHVESCQETVPEAITAFLEGDDFEDVIRTAVSLGGDCDTLTCIAGGIAEAFYAIPIGIIGECLTRVDDDLRKVIERFDSIVRPGGEDDSDNIYAENEELNRVFTVFAVESDENKRIMLFTDFFNLLTERVAEGAMVPTPFEDVNNVFARSFDLNKIKQGDTVETNEEVRLRVDKMKDGNGDLWIPLFLSEEELGKGDTANITMPVYIYDLLNFGLNDDSVKGVIVNPFGKFYPLGKDILRTFIEKCEEWAAEDGIEIPRAEAR
ncbi:MAG: ADP-ribosylglycohydrolase family protein [Lachnospiraceae bacterium]|nr:ADP-ribosylglycohydrolase family protein [Lachnospiraceae bacterium]